MSLTLEMPDLQVPAMFGETEVAAETTIDLLDLGETFAEPGGPQEPPSAEAEEQPAKAKRGRKKKQQPPESELDQDHPLDTNATTGEAPADATPYSIDEPLPPPPPKQVPAPPAPPMKIETSPSTRQFQIAQVRSLYVETCLQMAECEAEIESKKDELKRLQNQFASLSIELRQAMNDAEYQPMLPLNDGEPAGMQARGESRGCQSPASLEDTRPAAVGSESDAWRQVSINQLGLSPKLEEKLVDAGAINIGQLEDLRAEISQGRANWPKGVGPARITEIENAVIDWLSKNRDSQAFAAASGTATDRVPTVAEWEAMSIEEQSVFIESRACAINDGSPGCLDSPPEGKDHYWNRGYTDRLHDCELHHCIYIPGPEMDDWIRGWLTAGLKESESVPATEETNPAAGAFTSLDDL